MRRCCCGRFGVLLAAAAARLGRIFRDGISGPQVVDPRLLTFRKETLILVYASEANKSYII